MPDPQEDKNNQPNRTRRGRNPGSPSSSPEKLKAQWKNKEAQLSAIQFVGSLQAELADVYEAAANVWWNLISEEEKKIYKGNNIVTHFHKYLEEKIGYSLRNELKKWQKEISKPIQTENNPSITKQLDLIRLYRINNFLVSQGYSKRELGSFFYSEKVVKEAKDFPHAYLKELENNLEKDVELYKVKLYDSLRKTLRHFKEEIDKIIKSSDSASDKTKKLHDQISIIFLWYTLIFSKNRAIIYIKAKYWDGIHRVLIPNRSRTTEQFTSRRQDTKHEKDLEWLSGTFLNRKEWREYLYNPLLQDQAFQESKAQEELKEKIRKGNGWALKPCLPDHTNNTDTDSWNDPKRPSLAFNSILCGKSSVASGFEKDSFLRSLLNEKIAQKDLKDPQPTDQSGYAVPLLSLDRKSILGVVMVVSSEINTFNKNDYNNHKINRTSCEYFLIDEIASLTQLCLHQISQLNTKAYNVITILGQGKYYPEIVFDIWYNSLVVKKLYYEKRDLSREKYDEKVLNSLEEALESYDEQLRFEQDTAPVTDNQSNINYRLNYDKLNAIYTRAIADWQQEINIRFSAAVKLCFKELKNSQNKVENKNEYYSLDDMYRVRDKIEKEGVQLAGKSLADQDSEINYPVKQYLGELREQAKEIQNFISFLEDFILDQEDTFDNFSKVREKISTFTNSIRYFRYFKESEIAKENYQQFLKSVLAPEPGSKIDGVELKNLVFRLHIYFHVTISMLSTMELLPYATMFSILATTTSNSVGQNSNDRAISKQAHNALLENLDRLYEIGGQGISEKQSKKEEIEGILNELRETSSKHILGVKGRIQPDKRADLKLPKHWFS